MGQVTNQGQLVVSAAPVPSNVAWNAGIAETPNGAVCIVGANGSQISYILAQSAVPVILAPAGAFNATGQLTLGTALPYVPQGTVQIYLFAANGLAAGLYPATFSSTTVCQLVGAPATTAGAYSGGTTQAALAVVAVPAGALGPNGSIRAETVESYPNNANSKFVSILLGGVNCGSVSGTAQTAVRSIFRVTNRGVNNAQVSTNWLGIGTGVGPMLYSSVDTSQAQTLNLAGQLTNAADFIILETYTVEVLPGV